MKVNVSFDCCGMCDCIVIDRMYHCKAPWAVYNWICTLKIVIIIIIIIIIIIHLLR